MTPLCGLPLGVKDSQDVAGLPTSGGTPSLIGKHTLPSISACAAMSASSTGVSADVTFIRLHLAGRLSTCLWVFCRFHGSLVCTLHRPVPQRKWDHYGEAVSARAQVCMTVPVLAIPYVLRIQPAGRHMHGYQA